MSSGSQEKRADLLGELVRERRLTHKFAKTGRYASEEKNGEDMCQISIRFSIKNLSRCTHSGKLL
jgi:hypothetical protein